MIPFFPIQDTELILRHSLYVRATAKVLEYTNEHGSIGLTKSNAFNRKFVDWAASAFDWPGYTSQDLYAVNKVLNEIDFPPLGFIHEMLIALKLARHYKGQFKLTKAGKKAGNNIADLFAIVAPFFLFRFDHGAFSRFNNPIEGNWDIFLNILNLEAETAISGAALSEKLFGPEEEINGIRLQRKASGFYSAVLRPLCWLGLLREIKPANNFLAEALYEKTPLWKTALNLERDKILTST